MCKLDHLFNWRTPIETYKSTKGMHFGVLLSAEEEEAMIQELIEELMHHQDSDK